jgi:prepilin-type N-terminal cleavage/methylation domain-containing protein
VRRQEGFTLIELLSAVALVAILMTLAAGALRNFWLTQALHGGRDGVITQLRAQQERVVSESHPLVFGARFREGSSDWALVQFDPRTNQCSQTREMRLDSGVRVAAASFSEVGSLAPIVAECRSDLGAATGDDFVMFFARGTASAGSLTLRQPALGRELGVTVTALTGRVRAAS